MFAQKLLLPAFAIISVAAAQSASLCSQATATINSQADATQYASCSTIKGSVLISSSAGPTIMLDGPEQITGDLIAHDNSLNTLSSTTLGSIGGTFDLSNLTQLSTLQFDALTSVTNISFNSLNTLGALTFGSVVTKASGVIIQGTFLTSLEGIDLMTVDNLDVNNNKRLTTFESQIHNITSKLNFDANGPSFAVSFPNLTWANSMIVHGLGTFSIPSLSTVNVSMELITNDFESLNAPKLTTVGDIASRNGGVALNENPKLTNVSMPKLETVGGQFQIANNTLLDALSFPALATIGGALDFAGNFSTPELPAINDVKGTFNVQSSDESLDCSGFNAEPKTVLEGKVTCGVSTTPTTNSGGSPTNGDGGSDSSPSPTHKPSAANALGATTVVGLGLFGTLVQMLL